MKTICLIFILILFNTSCKNDDNSPENPVDSLPPATQIGAQTFGCLVDGKVFLPKNFGNKKFLETDYPRGKPKGYFASFILT